MSEQKIVANCETGEIVVIPLTDEEIAQEAVDRELQAEKDKAIAEAAEAKAALLEKLGITEEEAKLLLS